MADEATVVAAVKFNAGFDTLVEQYKGVLPKDALEISRDTADCANELERALSRKHALIRSFFKEEENVRMLTDSQRAKLREYHDLPSAARFAQADALYESVLEPALNLARAVRSSMTQGAHTSSTRDSDIIFRKVHEKQIRALMSTGYPLNDVVHQQAKALGLVR